MQSSELNPLIAGPRVLTINALAVRLGCTETYLYRLKNQKRIKPAEDGRWDVEECRAQIAETADPMMALTRSVKIAPPAPRVYTPEEIAADQLKQPSQRTITYDGPTADSVAADKASDSDDGDDDSQDGDNLGGIDSVSANVKYSRNPAKNFQIAKAANEMEKAGLARVKRLQAEGQLVEKDAVDRQAYGIARLIRDRFMAMPTKVAPLLVVYTDPFELEKKLREQVRATLEECLADLDGLR